MKLLSLFVFVEDSEICFLLTNLLIMLLCLFFYVGAAFLNIIGQGFVARQCVWCNRLDYCVGFSNTTTIWDNGHRRTLCMGLFCSSVRGVMLRLTSWTTKSGRDVKGTLQAATRCVEPTAIVFMTVAVTKLFMSYTTSCLIFKFVLCRTKLIFWEFWIRSKEF